MLRSPDMTALCSGVHADFETLEEEDKENLCWVHIGPWNWVESSNLPGINVSLVIEEQLDHPEVSFDVRRRVQD